MKVWTQSTGRHQVDVGSSRRWRYIKVESGEQIKSKEVRRKELIRNVRCIVAARLSATTLQMVTREVGLALVKSALSEQENLLRATLYRSANTTAAGNP